MAWRPYRLTITKRQADYARNIISIGGTLSALAFAAWIAFTILVWSNNGEQDRLRAEADRKLSSAITALNGYAQHPVYEHMAEITRLGDLAVGTGGRLVLYEVKDGKPRWRAELPRWVTAEMLQPFGKNLQIDRQASSDTIIVTKEGTK